MRYCGVCDGRDAAGILEAARTGAIDAGLPDDKRKKIAHLVKPTSHMRLPFHRVL